MIATVLLCALVGGAVGVFGPRQWWLRYPLSFLGGLLVIAACSNMGWI